jgi:hypothetical protein
MANIYWLIILTACIQYINQLNNRYIGYQKKGRKKYRSLVITSSNDVTVAWFQPLLLLKMHFWYCMITQPINDKSHAWKHPMKSPKAHHFLKHVFEMIENIITRMTTIDITNITKSISCTTIYWIIVWQKTMNCKAVEKIKAINLV